MVKTVFSHVVQGNLRGKKIPVLTQNSVRQRITAQKIKESIFHIIRNYYTDFGNVIFCDLFAGSGQIGIEAISRGMQHTIFCEIDKKKLTGIRQWLEKNYPEACFSIFKSHKDQVFRRVFHTSSKNIFLSDQNPQDVSFIYFLDPPYQFFFEKKFSEKIFYFTEKSIKKAREKKSCRSLLFVLQSPKEATIKKIDFDRVYKYSNHCLWIKFSSVM